MKATSFIPEIRRTGPSASEDVEVGSDGAYRVTRRLGRYRLEVSDHWNPAFAALWQKYSITELSLNGPLGWRQSEIRFLCDLPNLQRLLLYPFSDFTWQTLNELPKLEELRIVQAPNRPEKAIDLSRLSALKTVDLPWWPEWSSVLSNESVQSLTIRDAKRLPEIDARRMKRLKELRLIRCSDTKEVHFRRGQRIVAFEVSVCPRLKTIEPSASLGSVEYLLLNGPVAWNYHQIHDFHRLKQLTLEHMGNLPTLGFLVELKSLEYLAFQISTVVTDGDLTFLDDLPNLKTVAYDKSQRHYFPKRPQAWWDKLKRRRAAAGWTF